MTLNQVDDAILDDPRLDDQQDHLLPVQLADHEKLLPPVHLQSRKLCNRGDLGIYSIKTSLQVVEHSAIAALIFHRRGCFLSGNTEEDSTCSTTITPRIVLVTI
jgi:hypothetical protein